MNPRTKRFISVLATFVVLLGLVATAGGQAQAQGKKLKIILVAHGAGGNPFWVVVMKGAADAAKIFDVDQLWIGKDVKDTVAALPQSLDEAIAAKPDGLGITGVNPDGVREGLTTLAKNGVPIIIFNTDDPGANDPDKRLPYLFYIGTSEFISGQSNARAALKAAKDAGKKITGAVCPIQEVGHPALEARCAGYTDVMKAAGVTVDKITTDNDPSHIAGVETDYFKGHPNTNAINTLGPNPASGFYIYAKDAGKKPGDIFHTTHDTSPEIFDNISSGMTFQAVDQQPYYQGFGTVEWLWLNLNYKLVPGGNILTGPSYINKDNVARIAELVKQGYR
jgi:simple sugar transport system substrate-binding protein